MKPKRAVKNLLFILAASTDVQNEKLPFSINMDNLKDKSQLTAMFMGWVKPVLEVKIV
ncbi:hypothetical protein [Methanobacterium sp.]|uniref:hypothetical protein n=1 Tax=Methanobacterium sp. TaxID=2164 RepID=UPI003D65AF65